MGSGEWSGEGLLETERVSLAFRKSFSFNSSFKDSSFGVQLTMGFWSYFTVLCGWYFFTVHNGEGLQGYQGRSPAILFKYLCQHFNTFINTREQRATSSSIFGFFPHRQWRYNRERRRWILQTLSRESGFYLLSKTQSLSPILPVEGSQREQSPGSSMRGFDKEWNWP